MNNFKIWIARDKDGKLFLYNYLPIKDEKLGMFKLNEEIRENNMCFDIFNLDSEFPEVTWENSPQQLELKLIKNDSDS